MINRLVMPPLIPAYGTDILISHIPPDGMVTIKTRFDKRGKFGRILASIFLDDGTDLNLHMVAEGHAEPYMLD